MSEQGTFLLVFFAAGIVAARLSAPLLQSLLRRGVRLFPQESKEPSGREQILSVLTGASRPLALLLMCGIQAAGLHFYPPEAEWRPFFIYPVRFVAGFSLILILYQALDMLEIYISRWIAADGREGDSLHKQIIPYSKKILKVAIALIVSLMILQSAGVNVTAVLAGLGLGGAAAALAAKETLTNIFGGFAIIADKPFSKGDWIVCGETEGTVMDIGFRSTQLKTFYDSVITIPNAVIADSLVDNLGRRTARRTRFTLQLVYETKPEDAEAFAEGVKKILLDNPCTRKDYYQVYLSGCGASGLEIFVNFFLKVKSWDEELLQKQNIFLEILRLKDRLNLSFAFPTQTVEVSRFPSKSDPEDFFAAPAAKGGGEKKAAPSSKGKQKKSKQ